MPLSKTWSALSEKNKWDEHTPLFLMVTRERWAKYYLLYLNRDYIIYSITLSYILSYSQKGKSHYLRVIEGYLSIDLIILCYIPYLLWKKLISKGTLTSFERYWFVSYKENVYKKNKYAHLVHYPLFINCNYYTDEK